MRPQQHPLRAGRIHPTPVVAIAITGDTITVNGTPVTCDDTQNPYEVAVHAAARTVAAALDRPVRAIATDATSRTTLVVHPDGHTSDIQTADPPSGGPAAPPSYAPAGALGTAWRAALTYFGWHPRRRV